MIDRGLANSNEVHKLIQFWIQQSSYITIENVLVSVWNLWIEPSRVGEECFFFLSFLSFKLTSCRPNLFPFRGNRSGEKCSMWTAIKVRWSTGHRTWSQCINYTSASCVIKEIMFACECSSEFLHVLLNLCCFVHKLWNSLINVWSLL